MRATLPKHPAGLLSALMVAALLGGCAAPESPPMAAGPPAMGVPTADHSHAHPVAGQATAPEGPMSYILTVNVELTDTGFSPPVVSIPAGRPVRLVVRNRGQNEHHYHIDGLVPTGMLWNARAGSSLASVPGQFEHTSHHASELVDYHICTSRAGICPTGKAVHAHAEATDMDVVQFTATNTGTFEAYDPLYPHLKATVVVF